MCFDFLYKFVWNISHSNSNWARCDKNYSKCLDRFSKNTQIYLMKIRLMGAEMFHSNRRVNGQTDMTKLIVAFRNFANPPENTV